MPPLSSTVPRQRLDLARRRDQPEVVAQPLDQRPGDRDRPFERVDRRGVAELVADRRQQPAGATGTIVSPVLRSMKQPVP